MQFAANEHFAAAQKKSVESSVAFANLIFAGLEKFAPLNLNVARDTFEDAALTARQLLEVRTPEELSTLQTHLAQPAIDKLVHYSQTVYQIATENQAAVVKHLEAQFAELNKGVATALDAATKNAPAGSEVAVAAIKSAMVAANATYDSIHKAAKQVGDLASTNFQAAADAGVKAVAKATPKAKKAA